MKKIKLFLLTLRNTWRIINKEKDDAKLKIKYVKTFSSYLNDVYKHIFNIKESINELYELTISGGFKKRICDLNDSLCNYGITVFDKENSMDIVQAYTDEGHKLTDQHEFNNYRMYRGIEGEIVNMIKTCDKFLERSNLRMKEQSYKEISNDYHDNIKLYIEKEDAYHGFRFMLILNEIENNGFVHL